MSKRQLIFPCVISALIGGFIVTVSAFWSSSRVVAQWGQPSSVNYASFDPYFLSVVDVGTDYSTFPWGRNHEIFIGRGTSAPDYGHYVRFSFHRTSDDLDAYIRQSTVTWTSTGVTLTEASGDQIFVPKAAFVGGR